MAIENSIAHSIVDSAFRVHSELGPGLLESVYEQCLGFELEHLGLCLERQKSLPVVYQGRLLEAGYRVDLLVENKVIVEVKAVEALTSVHMAQILTYLRLSGCHLGLLLNFNVALIKNGIRRVALGLEDGPDDHGSLPAVASLRKRT
jgi:GxxExxY protein